MQEEANAAYAARRGYTVVTTYKDEGESGLSLENRPGLKQLLADAIVGGLDYEALLIFDVSRWGRFQDPDEAAAYEFLCRKAGLSVHYTTEIFENDNSFASAVMKQLKRAMAADFSRDLSAKVHRYQFYLHAQGFHRGGPAPYALQRWQLGAAGERQRPMTVGERKSQVRSRTILAPGPPNEVREVRRIFREFVVHQRTTAQIAGRLNARGIATRAGLAWRAYQVRYVLRNETYAGMSVLGKERFHLGRRAARLPKSEWLRVPSIDPIVSRTTWRRAQQLLDQGRRRYVSDENLIADLKAIYANAGRINARLIDEAGGYAASLYKRRFGSLAEAYRAAGFTPGVSWPSIFRAGEAAEACFRPDLPAGADAAILERLRALFEREGRLNNQVINLARVCPCVQVYRRRFGSLARAYELVGYQPDRCQRLQMQRHALQF